MTQEFPIQYYMVVDEKSTGPFSFEELIVHPAFSPESLVWKPGIENWVPAKTLPELLRVLTERQKNDFQTPPRYDSSYSDTFQQGDRFRNTTYKDYSNSYGETNDPPRFANNPQYQSDHTYGNNRHYHNNYNDYYRRGGQTNWLPWAIVATVFGFFSSCIGAIFGIIAIVQANKANTFYAQGLDREGDAANSNAKIMTIIGLILAGIGIIVAFSIGGIFNSLGNLSYI